MADDPHPTSIVIDPALADAIDALAHIRTLLVASDYDGTLAPLVDDPDLARPCVPAVEALRGLAELGSTHVALVSGRSLDDLVRLSGLAGTALLVGSHGSEFEPGAVEGLDPASVALLGRLTAELEAIRVRVPRARVERKPASVAFHTREVDPLLVPDLVATVLTGPGSTGGVSVKHGKDVVELTVVDADKGSALRRLRAALAADAVLFVGDDLTDEDAFTALHDHDVGVKVGPGPTMAAHRVADVDAVADVLARLLRRRRSVQGRSV